MENHDVKLKLLAQAIHEIRGLLSCHLGAPNEGDVSEATSAHLAYALHNEALAIIENRPQDFNVNAAIKKIKLIEDKYGNRFGGRFDSFNKE